MKNAEQMRDELAKLYDDLKKGKIKTHDAQALTNITGKMISSAKSQVDYYLMRGERGNIPFLDSSIEPDPMPEAKPLKKVAAKKAA